MKTFSLFLILLRLSVCLCPAENITNIEFIEVSAGSFTLGSGSDEAGWASNESRIEVEILEDYWISKTEITQAQWVSVMDSNPSSQKGDDLPVESISWEEAVLFCERLSEIDSVTYRLPTEAEWEWACRGASRNGGPKAGNDNAWTLENWTELKPVALLEPNSLGLYDMQGNVAEWCSDVYSDRRDCVEADSRVVKGGAFCWTRLDARPAWRTGFHYKDYKASFLGFRIVREKDAKVTTKGACLEGLLPKG